LILLHLNLTKTSGLIDGC